MTLKTDKQDAPNLKSWHRRIEVNMPDGSVHNLYWEEAVKLSKFLNNQIAYEQRDRPFQLQAPRVDYRGY